MDVDMEIADDSDDETLEFSIEVVESGDSRSSSLESLEEISGGGLEQPPEVDEKQQEVEVEADEEHKQVNINKSEEYCSLEVSNEVGGSDNTAALEGTQQLQEQPVQVLDQIVKEELDETKVCELIDESQPVKSGHQSLQILEEPSKEPVLVSEVNQPEETKAQYEQPRQESDLNCHDKLALVKQPGPEQEIEEEEHEQEQIQSDISEAGFEPETKEETGPTSNETLPVVQDSSKHEANQGEQAKSQSRDSTPNEERKCTNLHREPVNDIPTVSQPASINAQEPEETAPSQTIPCGEPEAPNESCSPNNETIKSSEIEKASDKGDDSPSPTGTKTENISKPEDFSVIDIPEKRPSDIGLVGVPTGSSGKSDQYVTKHEIVLLDNDEVTPNESDPIKIGITQEAQSIEVPVVSSEEITENISSQEESITTDQNAQIELDESPKTQVAQPPPIFPKPEVADPVCELPLEQIAEEEEEQEVEEMTTSAMLDQLDDEVARLQEVSELDEDNELDQGAELGRDEETPVPGGRQHGSPDIQIDGEKAPPPLGALDRSASSQTMHTMRRESLAVPDLNSLFPSNHPGAIESLLHEYAEEDLEAEFESEPAFEARDVTLKRGLDIRQEYEFGEELGRGKFGTVFRVREKATGLELAAKLIHIRRAQDRADVEREIAIMSLLQHPRLLQLYDAFDDGATGKEVHLVTELVAGGELFERIVDDDFELTEQKAAIFMRQICEGVQYMHSRSIVHLDMKPENILCISKTSNRIKVIDFGLARLVKPNEPLRVMFGTPDFAAPEVLSYDVVSLATDMWSVGVICYVLLSGLSPFMGDSDLQTMANVQKASFDFDSEAFDPITDLAKDFISKLLVKEPKNRLSPDECLQHPWLQKGGNELKAAVRSRRESMVSVISTKSAEMGLNCELFNMLGPSGFASLTSLDKRNLKKYVIRRKWHRTVHAIMALGRMGANLKSKLIGGSRS